MARSQSTDFRIPSQVLAVRALYKSLALRINAAHVRIYCGSYGIGKTPKLKLSSVVTIAALIQTFSIERVERVISAYEKEGNAHWHLYDTNDLATNFDLYERWVEDTARPVDASIEESVVGSLLQERVYSEDAILLQ